MERKLLQIHRDVAPALEGVDIVKQLLAVDGSNALEEDMEDEMKKLGRLIALHHEHLALVGVKQGIPVRYITKRQAGRLFLKNFKRKNWNTAIDNMSAFDLLFVAACYSEICYNNVQASEARPQDENFQQLNADLFALGRGWHNLAVSDLPDAATLFDRCAAWVVFVCGNGTLAESRERAMTLCERKMTTVDGSHPALSTHGRRRVPVSAKKALQLEREAAALQLEQKFEKEQTIGLLVDNFIPLCARVFLHIWADDYLIGEFAQTDKSFFDVAAADAKLIEAEEAEAAEPDAESKESKSAGDEQKKIPAALAMCGTIHQWMFESTRSSHAISAELQAFWRDMPIRQALALGAVHYSRRLKGREAVVVPPERLFRVEASEDQQTALRKYAKTPIPDIAADPSHGLYNLLLLTFYAFRFHIEFENVKFFDTLFVLNDDIPRRQDLIYADSTPEGKDRLPVGVQMRGEFFLHHNGKWLPFGRHLEQLLLCQLKIIMDEFDGKLSSGESIAETWASNFL